MDNSQQCTQHTSQATTNSKKKKKLITFDRFLPPFVKHEDDRAGQYKINNKNVLILHLCGLNKHFYPEQ